MEEFIKIGLAVSALIFYTLIVHITSFDAGHRAAIKEMEDRK